MSTIAWAWLLKQSEKLYGVFLWPGRDAWKLRRASTGYFNHCAPASLQENEYYTPRNTGITKFTCRRGPLDLLGVVVAKQRVVIARISGD